MDHKAIVKALTTYCRKEGVFTRAKSEWCRMLQNLADGKEITAKVTGRCNSEHFRKLKADGILVSMSKMTLDPAYLLVIKK